MDYRPPTPTLGDAATGRITFNMPGALSLLYGIAGVRTYPGVAQAAQQDTPELSYPGVTVVEQEQLATSAIGTPIWMPVTLKGQRYQKHDREGRVVEVAMSDLRLPVATVVEMARQKTLTKTAVVAASASVKEIYAMEDWQVRISGFVIDEANHPQGAKSIEQMQQRLLEWFDLADSVEVEGELFAVRGIQRLVLKDISFNPFPGMPRKIGYQITAESDDPLELILS